MHKWKARTRPLRLARRFEFSSYELTRDFLDKLGELCEKRKRFPDISFGKTYVNITMQPVGEEHDPVVSEIDKDFASEIDELIS